MLLVWCVGVASSVSSEDRRTPVRSQVCFLRPSRCQVPSRSTCWRSLICCGILLKTRTYNPIGTPLVSWHPLLFICRPVSCGVYIDVNSTATRHRLVLSQLDLLRYWKATSAYKYDVHLFLKHLDEKQRHRTLLLSVRSSVSLLRNTVQVVCCDFGVPCDCGQRSLASGQFEEASYASCLQRAAHRHWTARAPLICCGFD